MMMMMTTEIMIGREHLGHRRFTFQRMKEILTAANFQSASLATATEFVNPNARFSYTDKKRITTYI